MNLDDVKNLTLDGEEVAALYIGSDVIWHKIGGTYDINLKHVTGDTSYTNMGIPQTKQFTYEQRAGYTFREYACSGGGATIDSTGLLTIPAGATGAITVSALYVGVYDINVVSADNSKGTVSGTTSYEYVTGSSISPITISATTTPVTDWQFDTYTSSIGSMSGNILTLPPNTVGDVTVTANWKEIEYTITVSSADISKGTVSGTTSFTYKKRPDSQQITISTTTNALIGYEFDEFVSSVGTMSGNILTIPALTTGAISVSATWRVFTCQINVTSTDTSKGTVSGDTTISYQPKSVTQTVEITTTLNPVTSYVFDYFTADKGCTFNSRTMTIPANTTGTISVSTYWREAVLTRYGLATSLTTPRYFLAATSVGSYALFGGGTYDGSSGKQNIVEAYNTSLSRSSATSLSTASNPYAGKAGDYAVFINPVTYPESTDAYNASLTKTSATALAFKSDFGIASVGDYLLTAGGYGSSYLTRVEGYNSSLTYITATSLSSARSNLAGGSVGNSYALFAGGSTSSAPVGTVDAYSTSLTRSTATSISPARICPSGCTNGTYAIFAGGGGNGYAFTAVAEAYDSSLTRTVLTSLSASRNKMATTHFSGYAIFGGGMNASYNIVANVDAYNSVLTRVVPTSFNSAKINHAAASVGNYALFGGGQNVGSVVEVYTLS